MTTASTVKPPYVESAERFACDVTDHELTILHHDGLYRHLRYANPKRSAYWFDIVTWPGSLAVRGDMGGGYVFSRTTDMFEFFRARSGWNHDSINPHYWAEKLDYKVRQSVSEHSGAAALQYLTEAATRYKEDIYPGLLAAYQREKAAYDSTPGRWRAPAPAEPMSPTDLTEKINEAAACGDLDFEDPTRELLAELESADVAHDTFEWDMTEYTHEYLWCCHAIQWAIHWYDIRRAAGLATVSTGPARPPAEKPATPATPPPPPAVVDVPLPAGDA